jgi:hypothetical protein
MGIEGAGGVCQDVRDVGTVNFMSAKGFGGTYGDGDDDASEDFLDAGEEGNEGSEIEPSPALRRASFVVKELSIIVVRKVFFSSI